MTQTTDFRAVSSAGVVIATFSEHRLALKWAYANRDLWPGMGIESVTTTVTTRRLWTDRSGERAAA